jgi:hypothetical protein
VQKEPSAQTRTRSGPSAQLSASDEVTEDWPPHHRRGTRPLGAGRRERSQHGVEKQREGCPTTMKSGRGKRNAPPQAVGENSLTTNQTPSTCPSLGRLPPPWSQDEEKQQSSSTPVQLRPPQHKKKKKKRRRSTPALPRRLGRPGARESHAARQHTFLPRHQGRPRKSAASPSTPGIES